MTASHPAETVVLNGYSFHYVRAGSGPLMIFIHGTLGDYRTWRRQLEFFSSHGYCAVAYSRRFHYPLTWTSQDGEYSAEAHAEDLRQLIGHFASSPVHLVSGSWGGNVALQLALTHPALARSLVLGEPPVLPLLARHPTGRKLLEDFNTRSFHPARQALRDGNVESGIRLFIDGVMGKGAYDQLPHRARRSFLDNAQEMTAETLSQKYIPEFSTGTLQTIRQPVLLMQGDRSPALFHTILDILESCLPRTERVTIHNASHGIHADNAKEYNRAVLSFLSQQDTMTTHLPLR